MREPLKLIPDKMPDLCSFALLKMDDMKTGTIDQRSLRTRTTLREALHGLIQKKGYDAVTVADICAKAKVCRSTFYAHFRSKDDLKRSAFESLHRELRSNAHKGKVQGQLPQFVFGLPMFEHAKEHRDHYLALTGSSGRQVSLTKIREMIAKLLREERLLSGLDRPGGSLSRDFAVEYLAGAFMSVLTWWLDRGAKETPRKMDAMFRQLAIQALAGATPPPSFRQGSSAGST